jgi:hypothetical protein
MDILEFMHRVICGAFELRTNFHMGVQHWVLDRFTNNDISSQRNKPVEATCLPEGSGL